LFLFSENFLLRGQSGSWKSWSETWRSSVRRVYII